MIVTTSPVPPTCRCERRDGRCTSSPARRDERTSRAGATSHSDVSLVLDCRPAQSAAPAGTTRPDLGVRDDRTISRRRSSVYRQRRRTEDGRPTHRGSHRSRPRDHHDAASRAAGRRERRDGRAAAKAGASRPSTSRDAPTTTPNARRLIRRFVKLITLSSLSKSTFLPCLQVPCVSLLSTPFWLEPLHPGRTGTSHPRRGIQQPYTPRPVRVKLFPPHSPAACLPTPTSMGATHYR